MKRHIREMIDARRSGRPTQPKLVQPKPSPPPPPDLAKVRLQLLNTSLTTEEVDRILADVREGRLYTFERIARMLRCHRDTVRKLFNEQPGVLRFRRIYRVPETVVQRVVAKMMRLK